MVILECRWQQGCEMLLCQVGGCQISHQDLRRRRGVLLNGKKKWPALSARRSALLPPPCQPSMAAALNPGLKPLDSKLQVGPATNKQTNVSLDYVVDWISNPSIYLHWCSIGEKLSRFK